MDNPGNNIIIRAVQEKDCGDLFKWRNNMEVRKWSFNSAPVSIEEHRHWFYSRLRHEDTRIYVAVRGENKIGVVRFDVEGISVKISVNLNPEYFGKGFGSEIIRNGVRRFRSETKINGPVIAEIKKDNVRAQGAFLKAEFIMEETPKNTDNKFIKLIQR